MTANRSKFHPARIANFIFWRCFEGFQFLKNCTALAMITVRSWLPHRAKPHGQKAEVIISLTSYRPRFRTLHLTLECLLRQTVKPDRILVWVDAPDQPHLSPKLKAFEARGVEFCVTPENLRPFNKIVHTLAAYPEAIIVTVDDDIYYEGGMLEDLLSNWSGNLKEIVFRYGCQIRLGNDGQPLPFSDWVHMKGAFENAKDTMPFGFAGVLYPPGSLPPQTLSAEIFKRLCPHADDVWLFWMARLNGCVYRKTARDPAGLEWPTSQAVGLKNENLADGNQKQIDRMVEEFGWPSLNSA